MVIKRFVTSPPWLLSSVLLVLIGLLILCPAVPLTAQTRWSPPQPIPDYDHPRPPYLVADQNRTVHAFNYQLADDDGTMAIFYRQWTVEQGWTKPIDILLPPLPGTVGVQGIFLDQAGILHLAFYAGNPTAEGAIYYSQAPAVDANRAPAWTKPSAVGEDAGPLISAALAGDDRGNLIMVYSGRKDGIGLYEVHSADAGDTWSEPAIVSLVYEEERWPAEIRMDLDRQGRLHAVWSIVGSRGLGEEVYYARLEDDLVQWSEPILLAERDEGDYSANWASIIVHRDELLVIYMDGSAATRWMRRSTNEGQTWTAPVRPFPHVGEYEHAVLLEDSEGILHMILGNRIAEIHGMWHSIWLGEHWSELEAVVSGPRTAEFDPSAPQAVISQGNALLVIWWNNTPDADVPWYSYCTLDAPELPVRPLPTPLPTPIPSATATRAVPPTTPTSIPKSDLSEQGADSAAPTPSSSPATPILVSIAPVVLLLAVTFVVQRLHYRVH